MERRWKRAGFLWKALGTAIAITFLAGVARAEVNLSSFTLIPERGRVFLDWETVSEEDLSGFYMRRSPVDDQDYDNWELSLLVDPGTGVASYLVPGRGNPGAVYLYINQNLVEGRVYCYALEAVDNNLSVEYFRPEPPCVTAGAPTPTASATPDLTTTMTPGGSPTPTRTLTPVPSPTPATPPQTNTPVPSAPPPPQTTPSSATGTPLPTFLPTLTPTRTRTPTPSASPTAAPTGASLLDATQQAGKQPAGVLGLGGGSDLTLRTLIVRVVALTSVAGGLVFAGLYFLLARRQGRGE